MARLKAVCGGSWTSFGRRLMLFATGIICGFVALSIALTLLYRWAPVGVTPLMLLRTGEGLIQGQLVGIQKTWVPLEQISPRLQSAVIAGEDMRFFEHKGFDWVAIQDARKHNAQGRRLRGASTISQQVAKNTFLWPQRSWLRKGVEAYFTTLIELFWPKERILEVYLNVAELGEGLYGAEAASQKYFGKSAAKLTASEAALLAAVLPNPRRMKVNRPSKYVRLRQTIIKRRMPAAARLAPKR